MVRRLERITEASRLEELAPQWQRLATSVSDPLPFWTPDWLITWWQHFAKQRATMSDDLNAFAVRDDAGELVAVAPCVLTRWPAVGPLRYGRLQVLGADPALTEINPVLVAPRFEREVWSELLRTLHADPSFDTSRWWVPAASAAEAELQQRPHVSWHGERPMFVLDLPDTWEAFKATRSRNIKESLRKCYNSLARDGHRFTFHARSTPDELEPALTRFFALHHERACATDTVQHADWFAPRPAQEFLRAVVSRFAARGAARVFELEVSGRVVATRVGFVLGETLYLYYSGYSGDWARYSVMTTTTAEAIQWAIRNGMKKVNLSFGRDVSKTRWGPREVLYRGFELVAPATRSRVMAQVEGPVRAALASPKLSALRALVARVQ